MINHIKKRLLNRYIENNEHSRQKKIVSLEKARTIGIICQITDENSYKEIYALFSKLQSQTRSVWLMGYVDEKYVPYFCLQQLAADYFSKKNLNWYGKPDFIQLNDFINKDFDMLLDFSRNDLPPLRYILATTKAKLLMGANKYTQDLYDIYIKDDDDQKMEHLKLLKTYHNYLLKLTGKCK
jgi:hypothetical protein